MTSPQNQLRKALKTGDAALLTDALNRGADPNAVHGASTPLETALKANPIRAEIVEALVAAGAKAVPRPEQPQSLLQRLIRRNLPHEAAWGRVVAALVTAGAAPDEDALREAIWRGQTGVVEALVQAGAPARALSSPRRLHQYYIVSNSPQNYGQPVPLLLDWPSHRSGVPVALLEALLPDLTAQECSWVAHLALLFRKHGSEDQLWRMLLRPDVLDRYAGVLTAAAANHSMADAFEEVMSRAPDAPAQEFHHRFRNTHSSVASCTVSAAALQAVKRCTAAERQQRLAFLDRVLARGFSPHHSAASSSWNGPNNGAPFSLPAINVALSFFECSQAAAQRVLEALLQAGANGSLPGTQGHPDSTVVGRFIEKGWLDLAQILVDAYPQNDWRLGWLKADDREAWVAHSARVAQKRLVAATPVTDANPRRVRF